MFRDPLVIFRDCIIHVAQHHWDTHTGEQATGLRGEVRGFGGAVDREEKEKGMVLIFNCFTMVTVVNFFHATSIMFLSLRWAQVNGLIIIKESKASCLLASE